MCSFKEKNVLGQLEQLSKTNKEIYNHIVDIINKNKIKYVIGVIKDEKIRIKKGEAERIYDLGKEDFELDEKLKRVDIPFMNQQLETLTSNEELKEIINSFTPIYKSINTEKKFEYTYSELNKEIKKAKENEKKLKELEQNKKRWLEDEKKLLQQLEERKKRIEAERIIRQYQEEKQKRNNEAGNQK